MKSVVLIDTGPLVAFLSAQDSYHEWAVEEWQTCSPPFLTCDAVFTETIFLLQRQQVSIKGLFELARRNILQLDFFLAKEMFNTGALIERYSEIPMSLADASLVRMSELRSGSSIFTTDRDFMIYRRHGRQVIPLISPW